MLKKIKLFPAPHLEVRVSVSDKMIEDYQDCAKKSTESEEGKDCATCSWDDVKFGDITMCELNEMQQLLEDQS